MNPLVDIVNCIAANPIGSGLVFGAFYFFIRYTYDREFKSDVKWKMRHLSIDIEYRLDLADEKISRMKKRTKTMIMTGILVIWTAYVIYVVVSDIISGDKFWIFLSAVDVIGVGLWSFAIVKYHLKKQVEVKLA